MFDSTNRCPGQLVAVMATLLCFAGIASASEAATPKTGRSPVGAWKMQVTFVTCDTWAPFRAPFPALNTFYADGNFSEVSSGLGPAFRNPGHGRWARTGKNALAITSEIQLFDENFIYYAHQDFDRRFVISEDGNSMTGKTTYVRYGADGSEIFRGCSLEEGTRQAGPAR
jgi:hypothetical protein